MKTISLLIILILCVSTGLFGVTFGNQTETAYEGNGDSGQENVNRVNSGNNQIKNLVIVGAGYFLKSHSDFNSPFCMVVEIMNRAEDKRASDFILYAISGPL